MLAEWSILYPSSIFTSGKYDLIRLFDILSNTSSNLYAFGNYYESQSKLDISTLVESISNEASNHKRTLYTNKKTVYLNTSLAQGSKSLILAWSWPSLVIYVNCQYLAKVNFTSANDLHVLSLPYYEKTSIRTIGFGIQSLESSIDHANCPKPTVTTAVSFFPISSSLSSSSFSSTTTTTKATIKVLQTTTKKPLIVDSKGVFYLEILIVLFIDY